MKSCYCHREDGSKRHVISLDGPVVTASGFKDKLAVVTHASVCFSSNDQALKFRVFNISHGTQPLQGRLPLSLGSSLSWFGFSEEGQLSSYDSKGVLRAYTSQFGGSWLLTVFLRCCQSQSSLYSIFHFLLLPLIWDLKPLKTSL